MQRNHMLPMASRNAQSSTQQAPFVIQGNRIFCGKPECRRSVVVEDTRTRQQRTVMMPRELAFLHPDVDEHGNLIRVMQCSSCGASTAVVAEREHEHRCSGCGLVDRWSEPVKAPGMRRRADRGGFAVPDGAAIDSRGVMGPGGIVGA